MSPFFTKKIAVFLTIVFLMIGIALAEFAGWPFLAQPLQNQISKKINRPLNIGSNTQQLSNTKPFSIRFFGGITLKAQKLVISAPKWSTKPYFINADNIALKLRYIDVWRAYQGKPIRIKSFQAKNLQAYFERLADGRASWQFNIAPKAQNKPPRIPKFDHLSLTKAFVQINDVPTHSNIDANLSLLTIPAQPKQQKNSITPNSSPKSSNATQPGSSNSAGVKLNQLNVTGSGTYKKLPLKIKLTAVGELPYSKQNSSSKTVALTFDATVGRADLKFKGTTQEMMNLNEFKGEFEMKGPSLAAVGDVVNVTLPTTATFKAKGTVDKKGLLWQTHIKQMLIGGSRLNGRFNYDKSAKTPLLSGELAGKLVITDLGPAFGSDKRKKNKVLPSRPFDLASLRKMNADVKVNMQLLDLQSSFLEPLKPLQAHLTLNKAILTLKNINASTAGGNLKGIISLNGSGKTALWNTNLKWNNVMLERWVRQKRDKSLPPYISGKLNGYAELKGQGKSTAEVLASLDGAFGSEITQGAISHLAIEIAGLDLAQSIGVLFEGDEALPLECAIVNLQAKNGLFSVKKMIIDTSDTTVWMDGSLSFANETLNLKAISLPKDFSPLTVRSPLNIRGSFADPQISLEKKPIGLKLAASALLAIVNPLAAVLPFLDPGNTKEANERSAGCKKLMRTTKNKAK